MYKATVIETFIASPSDVTQERKLVREMISEWNVINSKNRNVVVKDLGWENDVYASFSEGRAQESINKQILENADLLIGIFWTRVGTPTAEYISGSVEEIQKHINAEKPVLIFFSNAPVRPDSVKQEQYEKLQEFKEWCLSKGLINSYDSIDEFVSILRRQFGLLMNQDVKMLQLIGINEIKETSTTEESITIPLNDMAKAFLKEIAQDHNGILMTVMTLGGYIVQTNGKNFGTDRYDGRKKALIDEAIEQLEEYDLIRAANMKRETFNITAKGYEIADQIDI